MSVQLALYKGEGNWVNSLIRWKTKSIYSHCELLVDNWKYSSTVSDKGVRAKVAYSFSLDWDFIEIPWADKDYILQFYELTKDNPYGWHDLLLKQFFNLSSKDNRGDFCSEWCAKALGLPDAALYSPESLKRIVERMNEVYYKGKGNERNISFNI